MTTLLLVGFMSFAAGLLVMAGIWWAASRYAVGLAKPVLPNSFIAHVNWIDAHTARFVVEEGSEL